MVVTFGARTVAEVSNAGHALLLQCEVATSRFFQVLTVGSGAGVSWIQGFPGSRCRIYNYVFG